MINFNTYGTSYFLRSAGVDVHEEFIPLLWLSSLSHYCETLSHQLNQLGFRGLSAAHLVFDGVHHWNVAMSWAELCLSLAWSCFHPCGVQAGQALFLGHPLETNQLQSSPFRSVSQNHRKIQAGMDTTRTSAAVPPAQNRASFKVRSILLSLSSGQAFSFSKAGDSTASLGSAPC